MIATLSEAGAVALTSLPPLALYIHIPWCVRKCPYCDFNSHAAGPELPEEAYVDALLTDLDLELAAAQGRTLSSIFFGGGTPSLFSANALGRLLRGVEQRIPFAADIEITLEANPGTFEQEKFRPTGRPVSIACPSVYRASSRPNSKRWAAFIMATKRSAPLAWRARQASTTSTWT